MTMEEESPLTPNSLSLVLGNLFCKESNGDPIDFYFRKFWFTRQPHSAEITDKYLKLKARIEDCGGVLHEEPFSCFSIELVFPELIDKPEDVDSDIFDAKFIEESIKSLEVLDLENFRIGTSPYKDSASNINDIMKGYKSWDSIRRKSLNGGRKLPDFGLTDQTSIDSKKWKAPTKRTSKAYISSTSNDEDSDFSEAELSVTNKTKSKYTSALPKKTLGKQRLYSLEEDRLIIDYIVKKGRYEEVRGKSLWVDIQDKVLHEYNRSWESAKTRFLKTIVKDLPRYKLEENVIEQFRLGITADRHLGGARRESQHRKKSKSRRPCRLTGTFDDATPAKHPALVPRKLPSSSKEQQKRQLYRQPTIPLPIVFSPQPGPSSTPKKPTGTLQADTAHSHPQFIARSHLQETSADQLLEQATTEIVSQPSSKDGILPTEIFRSNIQSEISFTSGQKLKSEMVQSVQLTALSSNSIQNPSPLGTAALCIRNSSSHRTPILRSSLSSDLSPALSRQCRVVLKRLTKSDLEKYGCHFSLTDNVLTGAAPLPQVEASPFKTTQFTVEISSSLLAARLSATECRLHSQASARVPTTKTPEWLQLSSSLSRQTLRSIRQSKTPPHACNLQSSSSTENSDILDYESVDEQGPAPWQKGVETNAHQSVSPGSSGSRLLPTQSYTTKDGDNIDTALNVKTVVVPSRLSDTCVTHMTSSDACIHSHMTVFQNMNSKREGFSDGELHSPCDTDGYHTPDDGH